MKAPVHQGSEVISRRSMQDYFLFKMVGLAERSSSVQSGHWREGPCEGKWTFGQSVSAQRKRSDE